MDSDTLFPQDSNSSPPGSHLRYYAINERLLLGLFGAVFFAVLMLLILICVYAILRRSVYFRERSLISSWLQRIEDGSTSRARTRGLDPKLVEALPNFLYTPQNIKGEEKVECTICLSEFEEGEKLRVLPDCNHSFHIDCIDTWFISHSNCPVCRTHVEVHAQTIVVENIDSSNGCYNGDVVVNIGVIEEGQSSGGGVDDGSKSFSSARESEDISSPNAAQSPIFSRLHSLKRMLSKVKEEKVLAASLHQSPSESEGQSQG